MPKPKTPIEDIYPDQIQTPPGENDHGQDHDPPSKMKGKSDPHLDKEGYEVMAIGEEEILLNGESKQVESNDRGVESEDLDFPEIDADFEPLDTPNAGNVGNASNAEQAPQDADPEKPEFLSVSKAAKALGMTAKRLKNWLTSGYIKGGEIVKGQIKIPRDWVLGLLDGTVRIPLDGKDTPKALLKVSDMGKRKEADLLQSLKSTYGTEASLAVQVYERLNDGAWQFCKEFPTVPEPPDLQIAFPEGGEFKLRIFDAGNFKQEVTGIKIRPSNSYPGNDIPQGASSQFDPMTRRRSPFRPGGQQQGTPFNGPPRNPMDEVSAAILKKVSDKAFDSSNGDGATRVLIEGLNRIQETSERSLNAEKDRSATLIKDLRDEAREEKGELKALIQEVSQGQDNESNKTLGFFKDFVEQDKAREKAASNERLSMEKERTTSLMEQQKMFFENMGKLDKERQDMADRRSVEMTEFNTRIFEAQTASLDEQRRNNAEMFAVQKSHMETVQGLQASNQPWVLVSDALKGVQETLAPVIKARLGSPGAAISGGGGKKETDMDIIAGIKASPFFVEEIEDIAKQIEGKLPPGFKANHLLGMMGMDSMVGIVMNYIITRTLKEVIDGVAIGDKAKAILLTEGAEKWWVDFKEVLIGMMQPPAVEQGEAPKKVEG